MVTIDKRDDRGRTVGAGRPGASVGGREERAKGLEPDQNWTDSRGNLHIATAGAPKALPAFSLPLPADADLRDVVQAWPSLAVDVRKMIAGVVRATRGMAQEAQ